jgi:hypothetical protein
VLHGEVEAWVQIIDVGPWISQKCASEIVKSMFLLYLLSLRPHDVLGGRDGGSVEVSAD